MPPDLATARALAKADRLGVPAEYYREILVVALAVFDLLSEQAAPVATPAPPRKR